MSLNVGSLWASLSLNISQFMSGLSQASSAAGSAGAAFNKAFGKTTQNNINNTANGLKNMGKHANTAFKDISRIVSGIVISQGFYRLKSAIEDTVSSIVKFHNEMTTANIAFEYFLGSAERAQGFIAVMQDYAAKTPFTAQEALAQARRLMAMSFKPEQLRSVMMIMTDAAAATGATAEQMDRVVLAIGQIKSKGKLEGQEIRQLGEAGIPAMQILREELGLTADQLADIGNMKIDGATAVAAILKGLEKRYKGAADRIAETVPGMWATIKDDFLIVSQEMTKGMYASLEGVVRRVRNFFETLRKAAREGGIGGIINAIFPPELQTSVRAIVAGIQSLIQSIRKLWQAIKPLVDTVGAEVIRILGILIPMFASVVRVIVNVIHAVLNASPAVRLFVQVLAGLLIATAVSKALMALWSVVRIGSICAAVARAVALLAKTVQALYLVLTKNPIVAIISVVAGALLALAMSSKTVTQWLDNLMGKLSALGGIDLDSVMKEAGSDDLDKWMDEFSQSVDKMNEDLTQTGKNAEDAGKQVKDKFVASFDELFQVPEKLDDISDGLGDFGMDWPELPDFDIPDIDLGDPGSPGGDFDLPPLIITPKPGNKDKGDGTGGPPDGTAPAIHAIQLAIENLKAKLAETQPAIEAWGTNTGLVFAKLGQTLTNFFSVTVPNAITQGWNALVNWAANVGTAIETWAINTGNAIGAWCSNTANAFANWVSETAAGFDAWVAQTGGAIGQWIADRTSDFSQWAANTGSAINAWIADRVQGFNQWATNTGQAIGAWATQAGEDISSWVTNTATNFSTWAQNTLDNFSAWASNAALNVRNWVNTTAGNIYQWANTTGTNIMKWVNNSVYNFAVWARDSGQTITNWINGTAQGFADWVNNVAANIAAWGNNAYANIAAWASNSWTVFQQWLQGTAEGVANWANGTIGNIVEWAKQAWGVIVDLARAAGQAISDAFNWVVGGISNTVQNIGSWISDNADWLIPVAVGTLIVGGIIATVATGGAAAPAVAALALEKGGIVDKEQLIKVGEKDRREAVIPMENPQFMRPFSRAVASDLVQILGGAGGAGSGSDDGRTILYVGNLIADEQGLKELERRLYVIRSKENVRRGS